MDTIIFLLLTTIDSNNMEIFKILSKDIKEGIRDTRGPSTNSWEEKVWEISGPIPLRGLRKGVEFASTLDPAWVNNVKWLPKKLLQTD